jgi:hypothetical protein
MEVFLSFFQEHLNSCFDNRWRIYPVPLSLYNTHDAGYGATYNTVHFLEYFFIFVCHLISTIYLAILFFQNILNGPIALIILYGYSLINFETADCIWPGYVY